MKSVSPVVPRLQQRFRVRRVMILADWGMVSADTIAALESKEIDYDDILECTDAVT